MPIPLGSLFSTNKELVNVPVQLLYSRRKLFEKILANVAKRKLENHVQATGDRMSMTPQQFGMNIAQQTKKSFMVGGAVGALGGLATSKKNERGLGAGRGALIGGGTELGMYPGAALGGLGGMALGGLISALARRNGAQTSDVLTGGALGAGAGALGGGYLGNIASRALLDDSSHSKQKEKKEKDADEKDAAFAGKITQGVPGLVGKGLLGLTGLAGLGLGRPMVSLQKGLNAAGRGIGNAAAEVSQRLDNFGQQNPAGLLDVGAALAGGTHVADVGKMPGSWKHLEPILKARYRAGLKNFDDYPAGHFMSKHRPPAKNIGQRILRLFETPGEREFGN